MKLFTELNLGFSDAINYKRKENKELLNRFFIRSNELDHLLQPSTYFLIGDKGTGKTAFSVYLSNNEYKNTVSFVNYINETEYVKFIAMKNERHLTLSDYTNIWKVLILLLLSKQIEKGEDMMSLIRNYINFGKLHTAIDAFYKKAFAPEIINAMNIVENSDQAVSLFSDIMNAEFKDGYSVTQTESTFQLNLLYLEQQFKKAIQSLKLVKNHFLFIDGIDIRPRNISYEEYLECVKGLANAVWQLNNDFFANIKDSRGRIKTILLVRPDIFAQLGLQNSNTKIRDNSVLLDWKTTYPQYKSSALFRIADRILAVQQEEQLELGKSWDYYFPFTNKTRIGDTENSFVSFLRFSMFRPRDILTLMKILQEHAQSLKTETEEFVKEKDFNDPIIRTNYSNYLLGEIKDYLEFYHSSDDYKLFLHFFSYLNGKASFSYEEYMNAYDEFADYIENNGMSTPEMFDSSSSFLQFLYDLNVICYIIDTEDGENHIHWSYRDKNYSNFNPKVKEGVRYSIHYGLQKALDTGKQFVRRRVIKR